MDTVANVKRISKGRTQSSAESDISKDETESSDSSEEEIVVKRKIKRRTTPRKSSRHNNAPVARIPDAAARAETHTAYVYDATN